MKGSLIQNNGLVCRGCQRTFDNERYLELDHNTPRSDGGLQAVRRQPILLPRIQPHAGADTDAQPLE